ncbi:MAG: lipocalin family protein [Gammaproteobacteria bacterium]|nr:lipocalin family protein [Gammaproteobacteria bacterium]
MKPRHCVALPLLLATLLLTGCTGHPKTVTPVEGFELDRYLGKWYEIARLDHGFERGLSNVTAEYRLRDDGGVQVINRGYLAEKDEWKQADGRAYFVGETDRGHLKVSFFGPFYGAYVVFGLDRENYQYAFISGPDTDYLWLLARSPLRDDGLIAHFRETASRAGFDTDSLIIVEHDRR